MPCIDCGRPTGSATRCAAHAAAHAIRHSRTRRRRRRASAHRRGLGRQWRKMRDQAVAAHLATVGPICPGWRRPPHEVDPADLTGDHPIPRAKGGTITSADDIAILCRSCNASKRDRL